jgi:hypothetical protein
VPKPFINDPEFRLPPKPFIALLREKNNKGLRGKPLRKTTDGPGGPTTLGSGDKW